LAYNLPFCDLARLHVFDLQGFNRRVACRIDSYYVQLRGSLNYNKSFEKPGFLRMAENVRAVYFKGFIALQLGLEKPGNLSCSLAGQGHCYFLPEGDGPETGIVYVDSGEVLAWRHDWSYGGTTDELDGVLEASTRLLAVVRHRTGTERTAYDGEAAVSGRTVLRPCARLRIDDGVGPHRQVEANGGRPIDILHAALTG
jgi:hypothetical protein